jgi:hypothetical protein
MRHIFEEENSHVAETCEEDRVRDGWGRKATEGRREAADTSKLFKWIEPGLSKYQFVSTNEMIPV